MKINRDICRHCREPIGFLKLGDGNYHWAHAAGRWIWCSEHKGPNGLVVSKTAFPDNGVMEIFDEKTVKTHQKSV